MEVYCVREYVYANHGNKTTLRDIIHEFLLSFAYKTTWYVTEMTHFHDKFSVCRFLLFTRGDVKWKIKRISFSCDNLCTYLRLF